MTDEQQMATASEPRWDGRRVLFEVSDAGRSVTCAISLTALQDLSEQRRFKPAELLACFAMARRRIEAIAIDKLRTRSDDASGVLNIWSDDFEAADPDTSLVQAAPVPRG